ncbi:MAG: extracellular solute-binding protein [Bacillota bacterium]|nr:extracellular solute-binding protein [Bacillota bacterium]
MKRKFLPLLLLVLVFSLVITACTGQTTTTTTGTTGTTKPGETTTTAATTTETPVIKLSIWTPNFGVEAQGTMIQEEWQKAQEAYLNVKFDFDWETTPWADYREKEKIVLASGDYPDIFTNSWEDTPKEYGGQGMLLELSPYLDLMKNYQAFIDGTPDGDKMVFTADGKTYGFLDGITNPDGIEGGQSFSAYAYRFDIMRQHGIDIPMTIDAFYDAAMQLRELYPDVYPINIASKGFAIQRGFNGVFRTFNTYYYNGTEFAYGPVEDQYKEMMIFINKLYENDLLDPEFVVDDDTRIQEKAVSNRTFIFPSNWAGSVNNWNDQIDKTMYPDMEWGLAYVPSHPEYGTAWKHDSKLPGKTLQYRFQTVISAKTEYPEICVQMLDYQYSDELIELLDWGVKGVTYDVGADGKRYFLDLGVEPKDFIQKLAEYGVATSFGCRTGIPWAPQDFSANIATMRTEPWYDHQTKQFIDDRYWVATDRLGGKESIFPNSRAPSLDLSPDEASQRASIFTACNTYANEMAIKFITGEVDIEANWDKYVSDMKNIGDYEAGLKIMNDKIG